MISWNYSYNLQNNMLLLVFHYPHFLITSCIHAFENYDQSIALYDLRIKATHTIFSFSVWIRWIIIQGMCRRASTRAVVNKCRLSSITAQIVLIFISVIDIHGRPPFFSHSGASFRFFGNVECHLCIADSAIYSNLYVSQQLKSFSSPIGDDEHRIWC